MKKRLILIFILVLMTIFYFANRMVELEYNVNLGEFFVLTSAYSEKEVQLLEENQPLIYGGNIDEPPLGIYYEEHSQYIGLVVDYINALSIEMGTPIVSEPMVWNEALVSLENGETLLRASFSFCVSIFISIPFFPSTTFL